MKELHDGKRHSYYSRLTGALDMKPLEQYETESEFLNALHDQILAIRHQASMLAREVEE
jgi:hypothetical protein